MNLYRIYFLSLTKAYIVANNRDEAHEMASLLNPTEATEEFHAFVVDTVVGTGVDSDLLIKEVGVGYFDLTKPPDFKYECCTWYPFIPFTVRGHFIDLALKELGHESV